MTDTTVVVDGPEGEGEASASFEAGVAAATSVQARQEAEEAGNTAQAAAGTAQAAAETAEQAAGAAYDAKAGVEGLREEFSAGLAEIRALLAAAGPAEPEQEQEPEVPAPEPEPEPEAPAEPKPKRRRYGSRAVFGAAAYEDD